MLETGFLIFETKPEKKFSILHHFFAFYLFCMHFHTADTLSIMSVTFCLLCQWNASGSDFLNNKSCEFPQISSHQRNWVIKWLSFLQNFNFWIIKLTKKPILPNSQVPNVFGYQRSCQQRKGWAGSENGNLYWFTVLFVPT